MTYYTTTMDSPCGPLLCVVDETGAVVRIAVTASPANAFMLSFSGVAPFSAFFIGAVAGMSMRS